MAMAFPSLSWWFWAGKDNEPGGPAGASMNASVDVGLGLREHESVKFPPVKETKTPSPSRRVRKKWQSREERRIDREYDVVLVPSDGGCWSGSETDDSDWSIGWLEPHSQGFASDDDPDSSFAVLVRCYGRGRNELVENSKNRVLGAIVAGNLPNGYSPESKYMEEWLSSLQSILE